MKILITGGYGFIGSALIRFLNQNTKHQIHNIDCLTYASNKESLANVKTNYSFEQIDISNFSLLEQSFNRFKPDAVIHLAAESHVDNSISSPLPFIQTNIIGTFNLLEITRKYLSTSPNPNFKFIHVSTDEVYGDLEDTTSLFHETTPYAPSSPYSSSKASSDHLVRAWYRTYGIPTIITNCSNNYGPFQHSEKLIPTIINNAITEKPLPIYGDGQQIRDWLFVDDHVKALYTVLQKGSPGESYNIGGNNEKANIEVVKLICNHLTSIHPHKYDYSKLITFVKDRPGHDKRYAICSDKIQKTLGWKPEETFESGLQKTINWYLKNTTI